MRGQPFYYKKLPNGYHVIHTSSKVTHSVHSELLQARALCKALNLAVRRARLLKSKTEVKKAA